MNDLLLNTVLPLALIFLAISFTILILSFIFIIIRDNFYY